MHHFAKFFSELVQIEYAFNLHTLGSPQMLAKDLRWYVFGAMHPAYAGPLFVVFQPLFQVS